MKELKHWAQCGSHPTTSDPLKAAQKDTTMPDCPIPPSPASRPTYGQGQIYRRSNGYWYVGFSHNGTFIRQSSRSRNRSDAVRLLKKLQSQCLAGVAPVPGQVRIDKLLDDLLGDYSSKGRSSLKVVRGHMTALRPIFGALRPDKVSRAILNRAVDSWQKDGRMPATINKYLGTLRRALTLGRESGFVSCVPIFPHLLEDNARQRFVEPIEFARLLATTPDDGLRDLFEWLYASSMRSGEATQLTWAMLDRSGEEWELRIPSHATKNRKARIVPVVGLLRPIVERRQAARQPPSCPYIFSRRGRKIRTFSKAFATACGKAGLVAGRKGITPHDFRRSAARNMRRAGISESVIMKIGGWKTNSMFQRYNIVDSRDMQEALGVYGDFLAQRADAALYPPALGGKPPRAGERPASYRRSGGEARLVSAHPRSRDMGTRIAAA